jgi:organic radical activating enzyme
MTHSQVEAVRHTRGRSALLFITDRCPVGCAHCSVDSRADSPKITNWTLFREIADWLCADPGIDVVGISGGEPFVERRGLTLVSGMLAEAGKEQVVYTSGTWAAGPTPPTWIQDILKRCSCVYLSTDAFHAHAVNNDRFARAARAIAAAGTWIVVQVLELDLMLEEAEQLLRSCFGPSFEDFAELRPIRPLTHGRGSTVFTNARITWPGHEFGPCPLVTAPVIRYDGRVTACCNGAEVEKAVARFRSDPLLRIIGNAGLGVLTQHPQFADLAQEQFADQCQLCWKILDRIPPDAEPDPLLKAMDLLAEVPQ